MWTFFSLFESFLLFAPVGTSSDWFLEDTWQAGGVMRRLRNVPVALFVQFCLSASRTFVFIDLLESTSNEALQMELVPTSISLSTTLTFTQTTETAHHAHDKQAGSVFRQRSEVVPPPPTLQHIHDQPVRTEDGGEQP